MLKNTRRNFIKQAALGTAAFMAYPTACFGRQRAHPFGAEISPQGTHQNSATSNAKD